MESQLAKAAFNSYGLTAWVRTHHLLAHTKIVTKNFGKDYETEPKERLEPVREKACC